MGMKVWNGRPRDTISYSKLQPWFHFYKGIPMVFHSTVQVQKKNRVDDWFICLSMLWRDQITGSNSFDAGLEKNPGFSENKKQPIWGFF